MVTKRTVLAGMLGLMIVAAVTFGSRIGSDDGASAQNVDFKTHDDLLLDIGRLVPEFGGKFVSEDDGILYVHVTDGAHETLDTEHVKGAIEGAFTTSLTDGLELRLIPAKYSIHQLHEWYNEVRDVVWINPNVTFTDLQEGHNRIEVGVDSPDAVDAVKALLASLNVPQEAILVRVLGRLTPLNHTLQDSATGGVIEGGYQIQGEDASGNSPGACTLGFNVVRSGRGGFREAGFITAGHCTESNWDGGVDGVKFYQPESANSASLVGTETIDPLFSPSHANCQRDNVPGQEVCRLSDAAFVKLAPGVSQNLGKIAKATTDRPKVIQGAKYRIVKDYTSAAVGSSVNIVGRTTGNATGTVSNTCVHDHIGGNSWLPCQVLATGNAKGGDSGAPVFKITNSPRLNDVELMGILWGGVPPPEGERYGTFSYSPISQIYRELGSSVAWLACDPSLLC